MNGEQIWMLIALAEALLLIVVPAAMAGRARGRWLEGYDRGYNWGYDQGVQDEQTMWPRGRPWNHVQQPPEALRTVSRLEAMQDDYL